MAHANPKICADVTAIHLGRLLPDASRNQPGQLAWKPAWALDCSRVRVVPIRSCSRWGLPCRRCYQRRGGLLPHPFTLTPAKPERFAFCGTFPKVALAGRYPAPCLHGARTFLPRGLSALAAAAVRPTGAPGLKLLLEQGQATPHAIPASPSNRIEQPADTRHEQAVLVHKVEDRSTE